METLIDLILSRCQSKANNIRIKNMFEHNVKDFEEIVEFIRIQRQKLYMTDLDSTPLNE